MVKGEKMCIPKLDKWDSQIMLLSKGHFIKEKADLDISTITVLRALWADRCGLDFKYVETGIILSHMIGMLARLDLLNAKEVTCLLGSAIDYHNGTWPYYHEENKMPMMDSLIHSVLAIISRIQVLDTVEVDGEKVTEHLITYEDTIRRKYGKMDATINSLNSSMQSIENLTNNGDN